MNNNALEIDIHPNPNPNGLFSIAAQMLDYNKITIKLQNSIAVDRN